MNHRWLPTRSRSRRSVRGRLRIASPHEIVHIIERRLFVGDVRRHFVGEVERCTGSAIRVRGYLFVYDSARSAFVKKRELRTRIFPLDNRLILNLLPEGTLLPDLRCEHDESGTLCLVDVADLELDISEFSNRE